jgi:hypothetical protein
MAPIVVNAVKVGARAPPCRRGLRRQGLGQAGLTAPPAGRAMKAQEAQEAAVQEAQAAEAVVAVASPTP